MEKLTFPKRSSKFFSSLLICKVTRVFYIQHRDTSQVLNEAESLQEMW